MAFGNNSPGLSNYELKNCANLSELTMAILKKQSPVEEKVSANMSDVAFTGLCYVRTIYFSKDESWIHFLGECKRAEGSQPS